MFMINRISISFGFGSDSATSKLMVASPDLTRTFLSNYLKFLDSYIFVQLPLFEDVAIVFIDSLNILFK